MIRKLLFASILTSAFYSQAQTTVFKEDFEDEASVAQWKLYDRDDDGENWEILNAELNELPNFSGNLAVSFSWYLEVFTPDNVLESRAITLPDSNVLSLTFKAAAGDEEVFQEHYAVYVIPAASTFTASETPVFEETFDSGYLDVAKVISIDISAFKGQDVKLIFRHYDCTNIFYIGIDDIEIKDNSALAVSESAALSLKISPNPATDLVKISGIKNIDKVRIFDMTGKIVKEAKTSEVTVKDLAAGQYIINVYSGNEVISRKLIKK
ncbi:choice-of-anchor J domain-containing protein [Epilithonimonas sp. JDS]|uniref:T9SS-dependent choice-of-anchor J family protein n=1 Tax=Epilithonimonas sp. JDS TaxID=2902797 RepID=UPI001E607FD7|nr:choice-of-anchor J domain-containing protein [Epilithonimonas sp. JDS]MCD9854731.1 choice-of-anchor J domain-containing protein [Epilithonimonas sp. JDS]